MLKKMMKECMARMIYNQIQGQKQVTHCEDHPATLYLTQ